MIWCDHVKYILSIFFLEFDNTVWRSQSDCLKAMLSVNVTKFDLKIEKSQG